MAEPNIIVIKRVKKKKHEEAHGGAWKVAYADFMTAMMSFFLAMWAISTTTTPAKMAAIADYFKNTKIYDIEMFRPFVGAPPTSEMNMKQVRELDKEFKEIIEAKLLSLKNNIIITASSFGLRVDIIDTQGVPIFELGSAVLNPNGKAILKAVSEVLSTVSSRISIEGHTDALQYPTSEYTNWELSTERASAARIALEDNGISPNRIVMVSGYAATQPIIKESPEDPRNRRISILVLSSAKPAETQKQKKSEIKEAPGSDTKKIPELKEAVPGEVTGKPKGFLDSFMGFFKPRSAKPH